MTEPTTEAGRALLRELLSVQWGDEMRRGILAIEAEARALAQAAPPSGLDVDAATNRLFLAVRRVIRDGIDSEGTFLELHEAFYAVRALRSPDTETADDGFVTCGIGGCEFAVERGEGRTMALHQSEDHPDTETAERHRPVFDNDVPTGFCECGRETHGFDTETAG